MHPSLRRLLPLLAAVPLTLAEAAPAVSSSLQTYLGKAEPDGGWKVEDTRDLGQVKIWRLKLVSQKWQGTRWEHDLLVVRPAGAPAGKMLLVNDGGSASPEKAKEAAMLATKIKAPVALLLGVPNQPLLGGLKEDDLIAETFVRYLDTGDPSWPLLFPMVKSVVKAMDALQEFGQKEWGAPVEKFILGGASKRGWATWLVAANDPRIMAITPMVIDVLNMKNQLTHQQASLGGPSAQISPYTKRGLVPVPDTERAKELWEMVDPWTYRERLVMPKLVVLGNNDPYWSTDALNLYWDALPGEKYISYSPNAGHDLTETGADGKRGGPDRAISNLAAFVRHQLTGKPMPKLAWTHGSSADGGLQLAVTADRKPESARLWVARSGNRDFRKARWESRPLEVKSDGSITTVISRPEKGFIAFYADLAYEIDGLPQALCTQLRIAGPAE